MNKFRQLSMACVALLTMACNTKDREYTKGEYSDIIDISYTWDEEDTNPYGSFVDAGAWIGFNPAREGEVIDFNAFYGPFDIDYRSWIARSLVSVGESGDWQVENIDYSPGKLYMKARQGDTVIEQTMRYLSPTQVLLQIKSNKIENISISSVDSKLEGNYSATSNKNQIVAQHKNGEKIFVTTDSDVEISYDGGEYKMTTANPQEDLWVVISHSIDPAKYDEVDIYSEAIEIAKHPESFSKKESDDRWGKYVTNIVKPNVDPNYNRVAVKSLVTIVSNWRAAKRDLTRDGIIPSHAVDYFVGYWAWDTWKEAVAAVRFEPELAKESIHSMFDFQDEYGMVADCVYTNSKENNWRNTKAPLASWAVWEIYDQTNDKEFVKELFPKLIKYYNWWFEYRDSDKNGICEYGSTDGTVLAAKWESGMDNAVRFDSTQVIKIGESAWAMDQESADLNSFLALEGEYLEVLANVIGEDFESRLDADRVTEYFFNENYEYFNDKKLNGEFVESLGCDGWTPLWCKVATEEQAAKVKATMCDANHFATYIPLPTLSRSHPKFNKKGYWRGPIWIDQVYFGINGLRKYGYTEEADLFTSQVFERAKGLEQSAPIYENYDVDNGEGMQAPHFSWSAAHLLMMYWDL